jgi:cobaltochelatase CobN
LAETKRRQRNTVIRPDGKKVNVVPKTGHLFVCADACCCGRVEDGNPPVPREALQREWEGRRVRNDVHLTIGGCLGPCDLANVAMLLFDGRSIWLHSFSTEEQVIALYDYVDAMLAAGSYLEPPPELAPFVFNGFDWP